jgi:hypothetical protein
MVLIINSSYFPNCINHAVCAMEIQSVFCVEETEFDIHEVQASKWACGSVVG